MSDELTWKKNTEELILSWYDRRIPDDCFCLELRKALTSRHPVINPPNDSIPPAPAAETPNTHFTYASTQATNCAVCGERKHTPLRNDTMGGYVCLTCISRELIRLQHHDNPPTEPPKCEECVFVLGECELPGCPTGGKMCSHIKRDYDHCRSGRGNDGNCGPSGRLFKARGGRMSDHKTIVLRLANVDQIELSIAAVKNALDGKPVRGVDIAPLMGVISILEGIRDYKPGSVTDSPAADKIDALLSDRARCMCGFGEFCENCSSFSGLNKLRYKLRHLAAELRGTPIQEPTLEDYGASFTIGLDLAKPGTESTSPAPQQEKPNP